MPDTKLADYFEETIAPNFRDFGWADAEINALKGAFFLGVDYALRNVACLFCSDDAESVAQEIKQFQSDVAKRTRNN